MIENTLYKRVSVKRSFPNYTRLEMKIFLGNLETPDLKIETAIENLQEYIKI